MIVSVKIVIDGYLLTVIGYMPHVILSCVAPSLKIHIRDVVLITVTRVRKLSNLGS